MKIRTIYVNWDEYFRLRDEEKMSDKKIAKSLGISPITLSRIKKEEGISNDIKRII